LQPSQVWELELFAECALGDPALQTALKIVLQKVALNTSQDKSDAEDFILALVPFPRATSAVIHSLVTELSCSPYTSEHLWLGEKLSYIVQRTIKTRPLTLDEMAASHSLAVYLLGYVHYAAWL
jgi:hypothetical protein